VKSERLGFLVFCVFPSLFYLLFVVGLAGCGDIKSHQFDEFFSHVSDTIEKEFPLRRMRFQTHNELEGYGSFFLGCGTIIIGGTSKRVLLMTFHDENGILWPLQLPHDRVRFKIDEEIENPTVKFRVNRDWIDCNYPNRGQAKILMSDYYYGRALFNSDQLYATFNDMMTNRKGEFIEKYLFSALITLREEHMPVEISAEF